MQPSEEVQRRRTFAIISHPDAGKTTLTEKLLLYGGAIHQAGSVKARKAERHATSDWMEIEKQRGISVTSSVMQFEYEGFHINILDTPGHQDFSEDTYRTLVAADCAVMLIDAAKGVEAQTIKLFHVCRMRSIPIFTFVNKMDRAARDPFELMEEIEKVLGIHAVPVTWPIGTMGDFQGVYHRETGEVEVFSGDSRHGADQVKARFVPFESEEIQEVLAESYREKLLEDRELLDVAGDEFDLSKGRAGLLTPMFFGSAMNNFGVESFLAKFLEYSLPPQARQDEAGQVVEPTDPGFSGFIFKIQANMNPAHRDRIAFLRICSGKFQKGMSVRQAATGKEIKLAVAHGTGNAKILMEKMKKGEADYTFIEVMGCPGGCVSGGGQPRTDVENFRELRSRALYAEDEGKPLRKSHENPDLLRLYETWLGEVGGPLAHELLHTRYVPRGLYNERVP